MMKSLNARIDALRSTRVSLRAAIRAAYAESDPGYRAQKVQAATLALRSTEPEWQAMQTELEARSDRVELAQLKHQRTRPAAAPVRRSAAPYLTRMLGGR